MQGNKNFLNQYYSNLQVNLEVPAVSYGNEIITYSELEKRSTIIAQELIKRGISIETPVGIYLPRGISYIVSLLAVIKSGGCFVPLDIRYPKERLKSMIEEADIETILTDHAGSWAIDVKAEVLLDIESIDPNPVVEYTIPALTSENLIYIIYTSGSTGKPKGIEIEHRNVMNLLEGYSKNYEVRAGMPVSQTASAGFDASLWEILPALAFKHTLHIIDHEELLDIDLLIEHLASTKIENCFLTTPVAEILLISGYEKLKKLKYLTVGGDRLQKRPPDGFPAKLVNVYGPAECCIMVTQKVVEVTNDKHDLPSIGKPIVNTGIHILNENRKPVEKGETGEIYISGDSVGRGYRKLDEETNRSFFEGRELGINSQRVYKTGDLGRQYADGDYVCTGRVDFQVKIRGQRIELAEIENVITNIPEIMQSAVRVKEINSGDKKLIAWLVCEQGNDLSEIENNLKLKLPAYMIPDEYIILEKFPLTENGKIDYNSLPLPVNKHKKMITAPENETEQALYEMFCEVLGFDEINTDDDLFSIGGHSLTAAQLMVRIRKKFEVSVSVIDIFEHSSIQKLAKLILSKSNVSQEKELVKLPKQDDFQLSREQKELWVIHKLDKTGLTHNIMIRLDLWGVIDERIFSQAVGNIINRHILLHSKISDAGDEPHVQIDDNPNYPLETIEAGNLSGIKNIIEELAATEFDLSHAPLFRHKLLKNSNTHHTYLICLHHLITDGWSMGLFIEELGRNYRLIRQKKEIPAKEEHDYHDYVNWERKQNIIEDLEWWNKTLRPKQQALFLKTSKLRDQLQHFHGKRLWFWINAEQTGRLKELSKKLQITLFSTMLSVFKLAIVKETGRRDVTIGTPYANRNRKEFERMFGYFTNMVALNSHIDMKRTFSETAKQEHNVCREAFSHTSSPFGKVADKLGCQYSETLHPIFQMLFIFQNYPFPKELFPEVKFDFIELGNKTTNIDLTCNVTEKNGQLECWLMYQTELYEEKEIIRLQKTFKKLLDQMPDSHDIPLDKVVNVKEYPENSCWLFGRTGLLRICAELLMQNGFYINGIISDDIEIKLWSEKQSVKCYNENEELLTLFSETPFDYIFSIVNEVIIPGDIYRLARKAAINYHDSPLPRYAGMYSTTWALKNGEEKHGISWHLIRDKIDSGDILVQKQVSITKGDNAASLNARCFSTAISGFRELLVMLKSERMPLIKQDPGKRTYNGLYKRPDGVITIDLRQSAEQLDQELRALSFADQDNEIGTPKLFHNGRFYIITSATAIDKNTKNPPGTIIFENDKLSVQTGSGLLRLNKLINCDGSESNVSRNFKNGEIIRYWEKKELKALKKVYVKSQKSERFWMERWLGYESLQVETTADLNKNKFLKVDLINHNDLALFLVFLGLFYDQTEYTCLLKECEEKDSYNLFNSYKPFNVKLKHLCRLEKNIKRIYEEISNTKEKAPFLTDLFFRYRKLQKINISDNVVICCNEYKLTGYELMVIDAKKNIESIKFNASRFSTGDIEKLIKYWYFFSKQYAGNADLVLEQLELIDQKEFEFQLKGFNKNFRDYPLQKTYSQLFTERLNNFPDNIAVEDMNGKLTYKELSKRSQELASYLRSLGITPISVIAVCLPGCIDLAVSALSILHAECIYLPLDSEYPQSRLLFMLEDSGAQLVIVNNETAGIFAGINIKMLNLEQTSIEPQPLQKTDLNSDIPAYLIYTSGSTGKPKGVLISNRSLINHNLGAIEIYELSPTDRILQFSSLSFDISIEEMFPGWLAGSAMVFRNIEAKSSVNGFLDFIKHKKITVADLPTAFWHELVQNMSSRDMPDDLRAVIVGGEKVNLEHYKEWLNLTGKKISFYNTYGPTETSVIASYCKGKDENNWEVFPIGIPVPNCSLYVLDSRMKFRPMGLSGNLYIGGEGVAIGYHNREKANYNAFKINPYTQQKVFHSGDTVRFNRNNELEFMGRKDAQLKISGFRIEPEEIVRVIESFQNVKQAFVDIHNAENVKLLTAWIQSDKINLKELTRHLKQFLPAYMIPARFIVMRTLPINANGKIDRKLLPAPTEGDLQRNLVEPYNEFQRLLCRLFQDILNIKKVGIKDNFFKLGGNSLLAMKLISLVNNAGMELSINDLFKHENIEDLSLSLKYNAPRQKTAHEFSLVEIQKTAGNTLPLVVCHLSPGDLIGYSALFQEMSKSVSVYGMQSPALFNDEYDFDSISELAKWYIDLLDKHFGNTDYVLFGHCFGGTLAYEIAYQLEMQKRPIAKLVLSETWLFPPRSGLKKWHYRLHKIRNVFRMDPGDFIYYLKVKLFKHNAVSPFVEIKEEGLDNPLFLKRVELQNKHLRQVLSYQYPKLQQHINLFIAKNYPKGLIPDPTLGWNVITKRYSIYRFEAEHKNILWKPAVKDMANALKDICKRR